MWELSDRGSAAVPATTTQVLEALATRSVSLYASVRPAGTGSFAAPEAFPELAPLSPSVAFIRAGSFPEQAAGFVVVSPRRDILFDRTREFRKDPEFPRLGFFLPAWVPDPGFTLAKAAKLFQMWPGWYVTSVLSTRTLRPGMPLSLHLIVLNLSNARGQHSLSAPSLAVPKESGPALEFDLDPYRWDIHSIRVVPNLAPGDHNIEFRSTSTGAKVAKSAAVAAATLGMVIYKPGHKGFATTIRILDANTSNVLTHWEDYAAQGLAAQFEAQHADAMVTASGVRFEKDAVLAWYRQYLAANPDLVSRLAQVGSRPDRAGLDDAVRAVAAGFLAGQYPAGMGFPPR